MKCLRFVLILFLVSLTLSCVGFRGSQLGDINGWPPIVEEKKSISYVVYGKIDSRGRLGNASPGTVYSWKKLLEKAYRESGLFSSIKDGLTEADIRAEIEITDVGKSSSFLSSLCGATLLIIPAYASDTFVIQTIFKDRSGNVLGTFTKQEKVSAWFQILLFPISPFKWPFSVGDEVFYDINRAILLEAQQNGIL